MLGSLCYATNVRHKNDKFGARAVEAVHMGYSTTQKGYKLYDIANETFFVSRDVTFKEEVFSFKYNHPTSRPQSFQPIDVTVDPFIMKTEVLASLDTPSPLSARPSPYFEDSTIPDVGLTPALVDICDIPIPAAITERVDYPQQVSTFRRSSRQSKPPSWLHDFVHSSSKVASSSSAYPISNYMSYAALSDSYYHTLCNFLLSRNLILMKKLYIILNG